MSRKFLHVGCGPQTKSGLKGFDSDDWQEIRFDIDESVHPDILGTLTDMRQVDSASVDAVYSSHNIEHVFPHEVGMALREFHRVLKDDGFLVITCPDLQSVCEAVVADRLLEPLYDSPAGPISPLDILYGHRGMIAQGNAYMAHKCGFTYSVLDQCLQGAGFANVIGGRRPKSFDLWMMAFKSETAGPKMQSLAPQFLP
ncbi:Methyltransferase type 11 [Paramagnetospirillum magnetotacticum MS-1]|uniref:Methyltransferase type 11 n=1 Tax=Paramagnetospirillum magnetotacticum MS-1 TaxID=272627 RepID=A0A0C2UWQ8_PARME|nr:methyltransferase domain-containing protein [Paramagnetospirillum magnetotacticum]KIL97251.1 Methyltransferase type 11 [Paramagnetospirillum magnetotacticum MS-1]